MDFHIVCVIHCGLSALNFRNDFARTKLKTKIFAFNKDVWTGHYRRTSSNGKERALRPKQFAVLEVQTVSSLKSEF